MGFTKEQIKELQKPLDPKLVKQRPDNSLSYVEGWAVEDTANEIFGFEWDSEVIELIENTPPTTNKKGNNVVSFRAKVRVVACGVVKEGIGFGSGIKSDIHAAYEDAIKEAETDAEKRALKKFGNRFGLPLYDKKQGGVKDVDLYDIELARAEVFVSEISAVFNKCETSKQLGKSWVDKAQDIAFVKRTDKLKYREILGLYTKLKKDLPDDSA